MDLGLAHKRLKDLTINQLKQAIKQQQKAILIYEAKIKQYEQEFNENWGLPYLRKIIIRRDAFKKELLSRKKAK